MDDLLTAALVGTAKKPFALSLTASHLRMFVELESLSSERQLLLSAGVQAICEFAAFVPATVDDALEPSPVETRRFISSRVTNIVDGLLDQTSDSPLLVEACQLMRQFERVLPPASLPVALQVSSKPLRAALLPVIGERGRWLARFDDNWHWAAEQAVDELPRDEAALEQLWNDGAVETRVAVLAHAQELSRQLAQRLLQATWPTEKAEVRLEFLNAIARTITAEEIPFLESLTKDRSAAVRARASELLCRLDDSPTAEKFIAWTDETLAPATPKKSLVSKLRQIAGGAALTLAVTPPTEYRAEWHELGITEKPLAGMGNRAYWLIQLIRRVRPAHWEDRLSATPSQLISAVRGDDFGPQVIQAWSEAAELFAAADWAIALTDYWLGASGNEKDQTHALHRSLWLPKLLQVMPPDERESVVERLIGGDDTLAHIGITLGALSSPWSRAFTKELLKRVRRELSRTTNNEHLMFWAATLPTAAVAIPPESFADALHDWPSIEGDDYYSRNARNEIECFLETVQIRARLRDYITTEKGSIQHGKENHI